MSRIVNVGVGCVVLRGSQLLLIRRHGVHGSGSWSTPGGYMEFGETFAEAAAREVLEETGVRLDHAPIYVATTNDLFEADGKHFVTIWMTARWASGEAEPIAADELSEVRWVSFGALPQPLFEPFARLTAGWSVSDFDSLAQRVEAFERS